MNKKVFWLFALILAVVVVVGLGSTKFNTGALNNSVNAQETPSEPCENGWQFAGFMVDQEGVNTYERWFCPDDPNCLDPYSCEGKTIKKLVK